MALLLALPLLVGSGPDPGILLEIDRTTFELTSLDLRDALKGPQIPVVLGSPAHPTPAGTFPVYGVYDRPEWRPGPAARAAGARRVPASIHGPMGIAKIPFGRGGVALHGGADPKLLGKPVSLGCARTADDDLRGLLAWLDARGALGPARDLVSGEVRRTFRRPARIVVR
ncbi:MAG: L,D-transpeptidase [Myxococcota bacterium]